MSQQKLKTAILGLNKQGVLLAEAAAQVVSMKIYAVADKDTKLAEKVAAEYGCTAYDDYRQLIVQNQFDCLLVAAGMHSCDEHIRMALKKKFNVLKLAPAARSFEEAAAFVELAENERVKFGIGAPLRFTRSFIDFHELLSRDLIEQVFLITAVISIHGDGFDAWQNDPKLAGGGVLLYNCYEMVDQMILNFYIPQRVYCLTGSRAADRQQRQYLTEDTAVVVAEFSETLIGNLVASKSVGGHQFRLKVCGKEKILDVDKNCLVISDCYGKVMEKFDYEDGDLSSRVKMMENFGQSILTPDKNTFYGSSIENLKNMAVIESAYLSARTGMPEEPQRILQMAPWHAMSGD